MNRKKLFILLIIFILPNLIFSQKVGISISKLNTNNYEIENPFGLSINLSQKLIKDNFIKLEYIYNKNTRNYEGFLEPEIFTNPPQLRLSEQIESKSYIHNLEVSIYHSLINIRENKFGIGFGLNTSIFDGIRKVIYSDNKQNLKRIEKFGYLVYLYSDFGKLQNIPICFNIVAKYKYLFDSGIITDIENTFNKDMKIIELQIGLTYQIKK